MVDQNNSIAVRGDKKGHTVSATTVHEATSALPEDQREAIRWAFHYMRNEGLSLKDMAACIHRDGSTLHRMFRNQYAAGLDKVVRDIQEFKSVAIERALMDTSDFVETSIAKKIWQVCEWALVSNSIVFIFGDSQIGKTTALEVYAKRNNHGQTKFFRMPATAGVQLMMKTLARSCNLSPNCSFEKLRDTVLNHLDKNTLVIVDEIHQAMLSYHKQARVTCLELLREIHDRTHCGMVLCGTNVFREEIQRGKDKEMLDQLQRRGIVQLQLPRRPPVRDLDAVAKAFGLPPAEGEARELMKTIIHESGLGKFVKFLQAASRYSNKTKTKLEWKHFVHAHDAFAKLSERDAV